MKRKDKTFDDGYSIRESTKGDFFYHIATNHRALCGRTMTKSTSIPFSHWGTKSGLEEKYCEECQKEYDKKEGKSNNPDK